MDFEQYHHHRAGAFVSPAFPTSLFRNCEEEIEEYKRKRKMGVYVSETYRDSFLFSDSVSGSQNQGGREKRRRQSPTPIEVSVENMVLSRELNVGENHTVMLRQLMFEHQQNQQQPSKHFQLGQMHQHQHLASHFEQQDAMDMEGEVTRHTQTMFLSQVQYNDESDGCICSMTSSSETILSDPSQTLFTSFATIKTLDGKKVNIHFHGHEIPVRRFKQNVQEVISIPASDIRLMRGDSLLDEGDPVHAGEKLFMIAQVGST